MTRLNKNVIFTFAFLLVLTEAKIEILNRFSRQINQGQFNGQFNNGQFNNGQRRPWSPNQNSNNNNFGSDIIQGTFSGFDPDEVHQNPNNQITVGENPDLIQGTFSGFGPGNVNNNQQITVGTTTTKSPARFATTQSPEYYQCLRLCPQTSEYNPICGSDNQNYHNLSRFNCTRQCGLNVSMVKIGPCKPL